MTEQEKVGFKGWAIVEVFGHRKLGGLVEVSPPELPGLIRVDVIADGDEPIATQYYGPTAIFCLTPCTESLARQFARGCEVRPVAQYELPAPPQPARESYPTACPDCGCYSRPCLCNEDKIDPDEEDDDDREEHRCACGYCCCADTVEIEGDVCTSCRNHAHQG